MLVDPKDVHGLDIEDPSFDVKTFGERAGLQGQYVAVPMEVPLLLTALIQGARDCESLAQTKLLLDKASQVIESFSPVNTPQRMTLIEHQGKKIRVPA